ncbi:unnamed protein product [Closterium sp. NIES-65]|nr:unnamed protein product [Closterium sp. NIES-65]
MTNAGAMTISRASLAAALLACFAVLLAPPGALVSAQNAFLVAKAKTLRAAANQTAADLIAAQANAAKQAAEVAAANRTLSDLQGPDPALNDRIAMIAEMNNSVADAQYDLEIANKILVLRIADLAAFQADPSTHPQIPAAQKAVNDATRRARMTSMLLEEWRLVVQEAADAEKDAERAVNKNPTSLVAQATLVEAQFYRQSVEDVLPDIVAQDARAQARLDRVQKELLTLLSQGPQEVSIFQMAVDDARGAVSATRLVYDSAVAAVADAQLALTDYLAGKEKAITDTKARLAKAKQNQTVADKKVLQLTDKLKAALVYVRSRMTGGRSVVMTATDSSHVARGERTTKDNPDQPFAEKEGLIEGKAVLAKPSQLPPEPPNKLTELFDKEGQSPWIDNLTRDWVASGHLKELVRRGIRGITSNPTIFEKAISGTDVYDQQLRNILFREGVLLGGGMLESHGEVERGVVEGAYWEMVKQDIGTAAASLEELFRESNGEFESAYSQYSKVKSHGEVERGMVEAAYWEMVKQDIGTAAASLEELFRQSNGGDGFVSLEVSPKLAYDMAGSVSLAQDLHADLARPNLMVKIPATEPGVAAIREMISRMKNINATLIFSLTRYSEVMEAYVAGLEDAVAAANAASELSAAASDSAAGALPRVNLSSVSSVASFFVSRVDSAVDKRLKAIGTEEARALLGKAAVAQAVVAYDMFKTKFSSPRWKALEQLGARVQRPLWASTGVKDPSYPDTKYIDALIGPHSVNTMPDATLLAFADHGEVKRTVDADVDAAYGVLDRLKAVGVDMEEVAKELEADGVDKFAKSFDDLLAALQRKATMIRGASIN